MTPLQLRALDIIRDRLTNGGYSPTLREIAQALPVPSEGSARSLINALVRMGKLRKVPGATRALELVGVPDLRQVGTDALRAELARRGKTLEALGEWPRPGSGRPCAHDGCDELVRRGHLFCRDHWYAIPREIRDRIFQAFNAGDSDAYSTAIADARDAIDSGGRRDA